MIQRSVLIALATCLLAAGSRAAVRPVDEAFPIVGTGWHGHTYPGATTPFGFVQLSPDTRTQGWDACSGYHYTDTNILGFSHTHLSGTGIADLADFLVLPVVGPIQDPSGSVVMTAERFKSGFSHDNELAQPGYYRVVLDRYHVLAELTATPHVGMHRYTFPASADSHLLLDLVHGLGIVAQSTVAELKVEGRTLITGSRRTAGWAKGKTLYFALESSVPFKSVGIESNGLALPAGATDASGRALRAHLDYTTTAGQQIILRVGLSPVSVEAAKKNLKTEVATWDFDVVRKAAQENWNQQLSRIKFESPNATIRQTFYSALYHTMTAPTLYNDADGAYFGPDQKVHTADFQHYSTFSLWDTFRAEHPLMTIIQPARVNDFIKSMLAFHRESPGHSLPMWPLANYETYCMVAYHSTPVVADAFLKGFRDYDTNELFQALLDTAANPRPQLRQEEYIQNGFIPWVNGRVEPTSRTLDMSYDDWCIGQVAKAMGKTKETAEFAKRGMNYTNAWDPKIKFFHTKNPDGTTWHEPFDPRDAGNKEFTEGNGWQYAFMAPQDVPGLIKLYGGKKDFIAKLDELFGQDTPIGHRPSDVTGIIGQYSHGNEPDQHDPYLFAMAGAQYKTAQWVREIELTQYDNTPEGIDGNDDCGQISAWYVFSAIGLYPLNPASGIYVIGSPLMEKATIQLDPKVYKGGNFTIICHNYAKQNGYIRSATLNGEPLTRPWITHDEITKGVTRDGVTKGGVLDLYMDIAPNRDLWADQPQ